MVASCRGRCQNIKGGGRMQMELSQVVYVYHLVEGRLVAIDRELSKLSRYSHDDEPIQRWVDREMSLKHEKNTLTLLLPALENERFLLSENLKSSIRNK